MTKRGGRQARESSAPLKSQAGSPEPASSAQANVTNAIVLPRPPRPTKAELEQALNRTLPDLVAPGLRVLFCGINPGLYTAAMGHHFARPGNRFWPVLHQAGFTPRLFDPWEERQLLELGVGITNLVRRATAAASALENHEYQTGSKRLKAMARKYRPQAIAFVGIGAYRVGFGRPGATIGLQEETIGETALWVLPSTSGLNANHQMAQLVALFSELREWVNRG